MVINLARNCTQAYSSFLGNGLRRIIKESNWNSVISLNRNFLLRTNVVPVSYLQITRDFHSADPRRNEGFTNLVSKSSSEYVDNKELESSSSVEKRCFHLKLLLEENFSFTQQEYEDLIRRYPIISKKYTHKSLYYLHNIGLQKSTLLDFPWLMSKDSVEMEKMLAVINETYPDISDINICAPLLTFPLPKLLTFLNRWPKEANDLDYPSKFHYLADTLEVPIAAILKQVESKLFLATLPYLRIQNGLTLLVDAGISKKLIVSDLWILRYSPKVLKSRIDSAHQAGVPVKPWLLRCKRSIFENSVEEYFKAKSSFGSHSDEFEYLSARLQCDKSDVQLMMRRCSCLSKVSPWKMKFSLDYLLGKGILPVQIILTPRVLCHRLEMVKYRIEAIEAQNIPISSLSFLCCSDKMFDSYLANKMKK